MIDYKKLTLLPTVVFTSVCLSYLITDNKLRYMFERHPLLKMLLKSIDFRTMAFVIPLFLIITVGFITEIMKFVCKEKHVSNIVNKQTSLAYIIAIIMISLMCAFQAKVNDYILYCYSFSTSIFYIGLCLGYFVNSEMISFLFVCSIYLNIFLLFAETYIKINVKTLLSTVKFSKEILRVFNSLGL